MPKSPDYTRLLAGSPFKLPDFGDVNQFLTLGFGATGHMKSTFGLDAPGPIGYIDIDYRGREAVKRAQSLGKVIFHQTVKSVQKIGSKDDKVVMSEARASWDEVVRAVEWCAAQHEKGNVQSVVLDTGTELYQLNLFKLFGRTDKIMKRDYGVPRHEFRAMTKMCRQSGLNMVILCHQKEAYLNDTPTGKMTWHGFEEMGADVDACVHLKMVNKKFSGEDEKRTRFEMTVVKAGVNALTFEETYTSDEWEEFGVGPWTYLALRTFPETTPESWGATVVEKDEDDDE